MPYVLKSSGGDYLKSKDAWSTDMTEHLPLARVYQRKGDAVRSGNKQGRYNRNPVELFPVEIEMKEKE